MQKIKYRWGAFYYCNLNMNLLKKFIIKIPKNIKIIYKEKNNLLLVLGPLKKIIIKLNFKLVLLNKRNLIYVTNITDKKLNNVDKKNKLSLRRNNVIKIKQNLLNSSIIINKKLKMVGVGYKVFLDSRMDNLLQFKLGYSHLVYYKVPKNMNVSISKSTIIYISGNCLNNVTQIASNIRSYKKPEPYKGKGILYFNEQIKLKPGKKV